MPSNRLALHSRRRPVGYQDQRYCQQQKLLQIGTKHMRISTIALANLQRRKSKAFFLIVGIAIGIGTAVALLTLSNSIREEIGSQLDRFGANIVIVPQANNLALDYGGVSVSSVSFDVQQLKDEDAKA